MYRKQENSIASLLFTPLARVFWFSVIADGKTSIHCLTF